MVKTISILGSTGSIGVNALEVISNLKKSFKVKYLSTNKNTHNDIIGLQEGFGLYIE